MLGPHGKAFIRVEKEKLVTFSFKRGKVATILNREEVKCDSFKKINKKIFICGAKFVI